MQHHVDIAEVQAHLVELLEAATPGDEIVILKNGEQVGTLLRPVTAPARPASLSYRPRASLEEFRQALDAFARGSEGCLAAYHGTYSRDDIYLDHD